MATALVLGLATTGLASAQSYAPAPAILVAAAQRAPLDLKVAGIDRGVVIALVLDDDIWVPLDALKDAGIKVPENAIHSVSGDPYVSLRALGPRVTYTYHAADLSLELRVTDAGALAAAGTTVDLARSPLQTQRPHAVTSGFFNYDVTETLAQFSPAQLGGFFESGFSNDALHFDATNNVDSLGFHRGLYAFTFDSDRHLRRFVVGDDQAATSDPLGSAVVIGGLGVSRNFDLQPDFIRNPTPAFSGTALSPTEADIYVNGVLYRTVQLQPGPFQFQNLNLPLGANVTQVVLHDAFGNVTQFGAIFYGAQEILRKGVSDYGYHVGFVRLNPFGDNDVYGPLAAVGTYRLGVTDAVTAGADAESSKGIVDGGPTFSARLPIGQIDFASAFSDAGGIRGHAESAAYSFVSGRVSASAAAQLRSNGYATIAQPVTSDRRTVATSESFGYRFSRYVDLNLSHTGAHNRDSGPADQLIGEVNLRTGSREGWTVSLERDRGSFFAPTGDTSTHSTWTAGVALSLTMGRTGYLQAQTSDAAGQTTTTISYSKSAQNSPGQLEYDASAQLGQGQDSFFEDAQYRANHFDVQEDVTAAQGGNSALVGLSGGLAFFRQGVFFTRPLQASYGLVHVGGMPGLPVSLGGIVQGTTDKRGFIVVPDLTPYIDNRVQVGGLETMPDFQVDATEKRVVPRDESGGSADFSVTKVQLFVGVVIVRKGSKLFPPRYGVLEIVGPGGTSVSDIGENGEFFFESLHPGKYRGTITYDDEGACSFDLVVAPNNEFKVDLGVQTCVER